jgi:hypothetical protein
MMNPRPAGGDPTESLNDWSPVSSPLRRLESPSSLALVLCLCSVAGMILIGTLTSSWIAALASALGFGVAIIRASSHGLRCVRSGRVLAFRLHSSAHLDLIPDPRRCEHCQDRPLPGSC